MPLRGQRAISSFQTRCARQYRGDKHEQFRLDASASEVEITREGKSPNLRRQPHPKYSNDCRFLTNQIVKERNRRVCPHLLRGHRVRLAKGHVSIGEDGVNSRIQNFWEAENNCIPRSLTRSVFVFSAILSGAIKRQIAQVFDYHFSREVSLKLFKCRPKFAAQADDRLECPRPNGQELE